MKKTPERPSLLPHSPPSIRCPIPRNPLSRGDLRATPERRPPARPRLDASDLPSGLAWGETCAVGGLDGLLPCPPPSPLRGEHPAFSRVPAVRRGVDSWRSRHPPHRAPDARSCSETWVLAAQLGLLASGGGRHVPHCAWARNGAYAPGGAYGVSRARHLRVGAEMTLGCMGAAEALTRNGRPKLHASVCRCSRSVRRRWTRRPLHSRSGASRAGGALAVPFCVAAASHFRRQIRHRRCISLLRRNCTDRETATRHRCVVPVSSGLPGRGAIVGCGVMTVRRMHCDCWEGAGFRLRQGTFPGEDVA